MKIFYNFNKKRKKDIIMLKIFCMFMGASISSYLSLGAKGTRIQREAEYNMLLNCSHTKSNCSIETEIIDLMNKTIMNIESQLDSCEMEMKQTTLKLDAHMSMALIVIDIYREQYEILKKENIMLVSLNPPGYIWLSNLLDYLI